MKCFVWIFPLALLIFAILLGRAGLKALSSKEVKAPGMDPQIREILKDCPPELTMKILERFPNHDLALAATLEERKQLGTDGLARLADSTQMALDHEMAVLAVNPEMLTSNMADQRDAFLTVHCLTMDLNTQTAEDSGNASLIAASQALNAEYLAVLQEAQKNPDLWVKVRENPMFAFLLIQQKRDLREHPERNDWAELLKFYDEEAEWLDDVLVSLTLTSQGMLDENLGEGENASLEVYDILKTIKKNQPYFKEVANAYLSDPECDVEEGAAIVYVIFQNFGGAIRECVRSKTTDLLETFEVIFANQAWFFENYQNSSEQENKELAEKLKNWKRTMPNAWKVSSVVPFTVNLMNDVPDLADSLSEKYGRDDLPTLLYTFYPDEVVQAAACVDKFGDLALYELNFYKESDLFHKHLANNSIGPRIIPYVASFEDKGLDDLSKNQAWLDKYFDKDGNPIKDEWWVNFPGGGALKVVKNKLEGKPSTWGELGWAALDVADAGLLVLSFGTSGVVTESGKTAVKTGAKAIAKKGVEKTLETVAKTETKRELRKTFLKQAFKKNLAKISESTVGKLAVRSWRFVRSAAGKIAMVSIQVAKVTKQVITISFNAIWKTYRMAQSAWHRVPANVRKGVYRSLLAVSVGYTLLFKTMPALPDLMEKTGEFIGNIPAQIAQTVADSTGAVLAGVIDGLLGRPKGPIPLRQILTVILCFLGAFILLFISGKYTYKLCYSQA